MNSIKKKLFFQLIALFAGIALALIFCNTYLYDLYYMQKEKKALLDYYDYIDYEKEFDLDMLVDVYMTLKDETNMDMVVYEQDRTILYSSSNVVIDENGIHKLNPPPGKGLPAPPPPPPTAMNVLRRQRVYDDLEFLWLKQRDTKGRYLILRGMIQEGIFMDLRIPLLAIRKNISYANEFFLIVLSPIFFIAIILTYLLARSFTKPVLQMNDATNQLKKLNFKAHCQVNSNDEFGQLANSINEMSQVLSSTIDSLNKSNKSLQQLINNVSHELKTPLALMQGYAEGLQLNVADNHERRQFYSEVIRDEAEKMNQLVLDLLDINRLQEGKTKLNNTDFDIIALLDLMLKKFEDLIEQQHINLETDLPNAIMVYGDQLKIEQIITNLLSNAIRYTDSRKKLHVHAYPRGKSCRLEFYNTCEPIGTDEIAALWECFYKRDESRTRETKSHGLGLSIVKAIQDAHGQRCGARHKPEGILFWFDIALTSKTKHP